MVDANSPPDLGLAVERISNGLNAQTAATLAAALIGAAGRPVSPNEAVKLLRDFEMMLRRPNPGNGRYEAWKKEFNGDAVFS